MKTFTKSFEAWLKVSLVEWRQHTTTRHDTASGLSKISIEMMSNEKDFHSFLFGSFSKWCSIILNVRSCCNRIFSILTNTNVQISMCCTAPCSYRHPSIPIVFITPRIGKNLLLSIDTTCVEDPQNAGPPGAL